METYNDLKQYVFALYWGKTVIYDVDNSGTPHLYPVVYSNMYRFDESHLGLRDLRNITDDEAIEVAKFILGGSGVRSTIKQGKTLINHIFNNGDWEHEWFQIDPSDVIQVYQYLQQQGFALSVFYKGKLYSVEELTQLNIIKLIS